MSLKSAFVFVLVASLSVPISTQAQPATGKCGSDRKPVKTRFVSGAADHRFSVSEFLALGRPDRSEKKSAYQAKLIEGGQEGRMVSLRGFLHGAALSADDSDYHIQITSSPDNCAEMIIVEVPDDHCVDDAALAEPALRIRKFIAKLLGKTPTRTYRRVTTPTEVIVTGQLFYDLHHESSTDPGGGRGKAPKNQHCKAGGLWEVHPVIEIKAVSD